MGRTTQSQDGGLSPVHICQFWIQAEGWGLALAEMLLGEGNQLST